jgi:hypothetical protein
VRADHTRFSADDVDQPSLHGILGRLRDFALEVESVSRIDSSEPTEARTDPGD